MIQKAKTQWDIFMTKFRDVVFIILFAITSVGWIITSTANKTKMKVVLEENTRAVNELKSEVREINRTLKEQAVLNGQIIQYMKD